MFIKDIILYIAQHDAKAIEFIWRYKASRIIEYGSYIPFSLAPAAKILWWRHISPRINHVIPALIR